MDLARDATSSGFKRVGLRVLTAIMAAISLSRSLARSSWSAWPRAEEVPLVSFSNSPLMSRKSRWRFFSTEQRAQYHFGLRAALGERPSAARPNEAPPSE